MGFKVIVSSSFTVAFTETIKVKRVFPRVPSPHLLSLHDYLCPGDQPVSLEAQDRSILSS